MLDVMFNNNGIIVLFFVAGLFMGRVSALLAEFFSFLQSHHVGEESKAEGTSPSDHDPHVGEESKVVSISFDPIAFIVECQNAWGWMVCSYPYKKLMWFLSRRGEKLKQELSVRPFILEVLMGVLFALLFHHVGWKYLLLEYLLFAFALVTASAVDWEYMILPDSFTLSGIGIGLLGALLNPEVGREFWPAFGGMLMGGGFLWTIAFLYYALKKEEGLGGGDIKLLAWIGAVLTWEAVPFVILLSCFTGLLSAFFMMFRSSKRYFKQSIPFGPYLAFSALVYILWGQNLAQIYLSWFLLH